MRKSASEMMSQSEEDCTHLQTQVIDLTTKWERVCRLSGNKQERLDTARQEAEAFHKKTHGLLDWLADAERSLRYQGALPEDEDTLVNQLDEHKVTHHTILTNMPTV